MQPLSFPIRSRFVFSSALFAIGASFRPAIAQAPPAPAPAFIVGSALRADVAVLRRALEALHPGLYRYNTREQLDRSFRALEAKLGRGATIGDAFLAIGEFTNTLKCGHSFPNPANQSDAVAEAVFGKTGRVPFYFQWLDGKMIVTLDVSREHAFPAGTEVVAINGVSAATILNRLLAYARADGSNDAKRVANMALHTSERWEAFDVYYPLVFQPPATGDWTFRVRAPGGKTTSVRAAPANIAQRMALYDSLRRVARDTTTPPWKFAIDRDSIATLTMSTWVTFNDHWDWQGFVHRAFQEIDARGVKTLVIDLRGNEGGTSVGDVILSHLVDREMTPLPFQRYTRYQRIPADLRPYLDTWDRSFDDWGDGASPAASPPAAGASGFFRLTRYDSDTTGDVVRPIAPRFRGRVFVLVGADNSSATFQFALAIRERRLGTLVGQPTGGNQRGINGGAYYFLRLPNSRIEVDLPLIGYFASDARPDAGVLPDVTVRVTAEDIARGRDPEMDAVRRIVARSGREAAGAARKR